LLSYGVDQVDIFRRAAAWGQTIVIELIYAGPTPAVREGTITESHDPPMAGIIAAALQPDTAKRTDGTKGPVDQFSTQS
jgi:hypothetical protein